MAGTGGVFLGESVLNVLSVIDPELLFLCNVPLPTPLPVCDDSEPLRAVRFVCRFPMGSGEVVCDRRAAAAAAEESEALEDAFFRKAWLAASVAAAGGGALFLGCA